MPPPSRSSADATPFARLLDHGFAMRRIGRAAVQIAFDRNADDDRPGFPVVSIASCGFISVERVAVMPTKRRRDHARRLSPNLIEQACGAGHDQRVCEVTSALQTPPRTPSLPRWASPKWVPRRPDNHETVRSLRRVL
jgi:predicted GNAT superfamily acetyltransferase